jgi:hypothetical protein
MWDPTAPGSTSQQDNQYAEPSGDVDLGGSPVLTDDDGVKWRLLVGTDGALSTEEIT